MQSFIQSILAFVSLHAGWFCAAGIFVVDYIFALKPNWEASGLGHWIHLTIKNLLGGSSQPPAAP